MVMVHPAAGNTESSRRVSGLRSAIIDEASYRVVPCVDLPARPAVPIRGRIAPALRGATFPVRAASLGSLCDTGNRADHTVVVGAGQGAYGVCGDKILAEIPPFPQRR